jgi:hypothetical protein
MFCKRCGADDSDTPPMMIYKTSSAVFLWAHLVIHALFAKLEISLASRKNKLKSGLNPNET